MSQGFTDQKRRVATEAECNARWNGLARGIGFRCYLCGHKFVVGDGWRWIYMKRTINAIVCDSCDGPDVVERWHARVDEFYSDKFWALRSD